MLDYHDRPAPFDLKGRMDYLSNAMGRGDLKPAHLAVAMALVSHVDREGNCFPSQARIAKLAGIERHSAARTLKQLAEMGLVEIGVRRRVGGRWRTPDYRLCPPPWNN